MFKERFIRWSNALTRLRVRGVDATQLLLLLPHCLQLSKCDRQISPDCTQCARCGRCDVTDLLGLSEHYGLPMSVAGGGREALKLVRAARIKAVVAVACEQELWDGIRAAFPKPVFAVPLSTPNGSCHDTKVAAFLVENAIRRLLGLGDDSEPTRITSPDQPAEQPTQA